MIKILGIVLFLSILWLLLFTWYSDHKLRHLEDTLTNTICPYGHLAEYCPQVQKHGIAWHLYNCPLRASK